MVRALALELTLTQRDAERIWTAMLGQISSALVAGRTVGFKNVGTLEPYVRARRRAYVPYHRAYVVRPAQRYVRFVPSLKLRDALQTAKD